LVHSGIKRGASRDAFYAYLMQSYEKKLQKANDLPSFEQIWSKKIKT